MITYAILDLLPSEEMVNKDRAQGTLCHTAIAHNGSAIMIDLASSQATYVNVPGSDTQSIGTPALVWGEHQSSMDSLQCNGVCKVSLQN